MTVWLLTVALVLPPPEAGLPFVSEAKCKQAAVEAAFTVPGVKYYCTEVQRTEVHNIFFIELAQSKERVVRARTKRRQERALRALYKSRRR